MTQRQGSLLSAGLILSLALMLGRLAGFAREILLASSLGLSPQADLAIVLLTIPDLLVNLLLSGGIGVALVPALRQAGDAQATALYMQASLTVGGIFLGLATVFVMVPYALLWLLAPGVGSPAVWLEDWMIYAVAAAIPLTALAGVSTAALNAMDRFFIAGCGTLVFNLCVIAGLLLAVFTQADPIKWLCVGILVGALLRSFSQLLVLRPIGTAGPKLGAQPWLIDLSLLKAFLAGLGSVSLLILVPVALRASASVLGEGELAAFNYAIKLVELPLGILITSIATVAFPRLSGAHDRQDDALFDRTLQFSVERSLVLSIIVVLCGLPFIGAAVNVLFGNGKVEESGLDHITSLSQIALLSVPSVGVSSLAAAALNARGQAAVVLRCTLFSMLFLFLLCLPGILAAESIMLMWVLPVFHLLFALILVSALGYRHFMLSRGSIVNIARSAAFCVFLVSISVSINAYVLKSVAVASTNSDVWRLLLAGVTFMSAVTLGLSTLRSEKGKGHEAAN